MAKEVKLFQALGREGRAQMYELHKQIEREMRRAHIEAHIENIQREKDKQRKVLQATLADLKARRMVKPATVKGQVNLKSFEKLMLKEA